MYHSQKEPHDPMQRQHHAEAEGDAEGDAEEGEQERSTFIGDPTHPARHQGTNPGCSRHHGRVTNLR